MKTDQKEETGGGAAAEYLRELAARRERENETLRLQQAGLKALEKAPDSGYLHEMLELAKPRPPKADAKRLQRQAKALALGDALALAGKSIGAMAGVPQRPADQSLLARTLDQRRRLEESFAAENHRYRQMLLSDAARLDKQADRRLQDSTAALRRQAAATQTRLAEVDRLQARHLDREVRTAYDRQTLEEKQRYGRETAALRNARPAATAKPQDETVFSYYDGDDEVKIDRARFNTIAARIPEDKLYQEYARNRSKQAQTGAVLNALVRIDRQMRAAKQPAAAPVVPEAPTAPKK